MLVYDDLQGYSDVAHNDAINASLSAISDAIEALNNLLILIKSQIELIPWEERVIVAYMKSFKLLQAGFMEIAQNARRNKKNYVIASEIMVKLFEIYSNLFDVVDDKIDKETIIESYSKGHNSLFNAINIYYKVRLGNKFPN